MSRSKKVTEGKVRVELVPGSFVMAISKVLMHGVKEYGAWDWLKGRSWMEIFGATLRHLYAWARGEELDPKSGLPHLDHAATNIMFLSTWGRIKKGTDDRKKNI